MSTLRDNWSSGDAYEQYVGRWSRLVAAEFVRWLAVPADRDWLDVGCGTGALTEVILRQAAPRRVMAHDISLPYLALARERIPDERAEFTHADAVMLPSAHATFDIAVSGIAINFVPDAPVAVREMRRVVRPQGTVALYVWDYADGMQLIRSFWDAAVSLDPNAANLDEAFRFPVCRPGPLRALFENAGLYDVDIRPIDVPTRFASFEEYWMPFEGAQGPAPSYVAALDRERRNQLRATLEKTLPRQPDGSIELMARAWAARGTVV